MMRTLVIVLNWNGLADTLECLDALERQTHNQFDVLVIDNGSAGDDAARLAENLTLRRESANNGENGPISTKSQNLSARRPQLILHIEPTNLGSTEVNFPLSIQPYLWTLVN